MKTHLKGFLIAILIIILVYTPVVLIVKNIIVFDSLDRYLLLLIIVMGAMQFIYLLEAMLIKEWFMECGYYHFYIMIFTMIYHIIYLLISFES